MTREDLIMSKMYNNILYYIEMLKYNNFYNYGSYYLDLLIKEINNMYAFHIYYINQLNELRYLNDIRLNNIKKYTIEDLSYYDGTNGKPAYVAVNGIIYDVSLEPTWGGGTHFKLYSGKNLTVPFNSCHKIEVLDKLPKVGTLIEKVDDINE